MYIISTLLILSNFLILITCSLDHDSSLIIKLEHALNGGPNPEFVERGNVTIQSLRIGQAIVNQIQLTDTERRQIQKLAADNELYKIRSTAILNDGTERTFMSVTKACMLAESQLDDRLAVSLDYTGRVVGIALVIVSKSTCEGVHVPIEKLTGFTTNVFVRHTETPPIPDTASLIQRLDREKEAKERGEVKDNRSFLAKYWMYIVPVVIVMVISGASNPEAQQAAVQQ